MITFRRVQCRDGVFHPTTAGVSMNTRALKTTSVRGSSVRIAIPCLTATTGTEFAIHETPNARPDGQQKRAFSTVIIRVVVLDFVKRKNPQKKLHAIKRQRYWHINGTDREDYNTVKRDLEFFLQTFRICFDRSGQFEDYV